MAEQQTGLPRIFVVSHPDHGERVGIWEVHPEHPNGEVFVYGQETEPVEVALTPAVQEALTNQGDRGEEPPRLVRLEGPALEQRRKLVKLVSERNSTAAASSAVAAGRAVVTEVAGEKHAEEVRKLEEKLAKLQEELDKSKVESAEVVREVAAKDAEDADTTGQLNEDERETVGNVPHATPETANTEERRRAPRARTGV